MPRIDGSRLAAPSTLARKTLVLFTASYPYSVANENSFLPQEIDVLRQHFETIILIPAETRGGRAELTAPNVEVDPSYAAFIASTPRKFVYALFGLVDPRLLGELRSSFSVFVQRPRVVLRTLRAYVFSRMTERWIHTLSRRVRWTETVLYTWWFDATTLGVATFGNMSAVPVITRAHGGDLYESRYDPAYLPFRRQSLQRIQNVFSASHAGAQYLAKRYPEFSDKVRTALLGVPDPGFVNMPSTDGVFRLLSCSFLSPVKRVDLMVRGLAAAGRAFPLQRFEWTHIGVGPEKESLASLAASILPGNVKHELLNYPGKEGLQLYYRTRPVDVFLNTSKSEGTPVAIMEAISVDIPVIATSVGGNTEIVGPENGILVAADPHPSEIAEAIGALVHAEEGLTRLRVGSGAKWGDQYSAHQNYSAFAEILKAL